MTNELEKKFFQCFGIEPNCKFVKYCDDCTKCGCYHYPQISDHILLELICICCKAFNLLNIELSVVFAFNIDEIKQSILTRLIWLDEVYNNKEIKHQIRTLFEEEE